MKSAGSMSSLAPLMALLMMGCGQRSETVGADLLGDQSLSSTRLETGDGVGVGLHHLAGEGPPVLLVHGVASNHHSFHLGERSFARALVDQGLDVWMLDLRGTGPHRGDPEAGWGSGTRWSLDDYAQQDVPAAVAHILESTGAESVGYVGHSMGGMVGAMYLAEHPDAPLSGFVALGSPVDFSEPGAQTELALGSARFNPSPWVDARLGAKLRAGLGGEPRTPLDAWVDQQLFNDLDPAFRQEFYQEVASRMTRGEMKHLGLMGQVGTLCDAGGEPVLPELAEVQVPTQVWAGSADRVAPPAQVLPLAEALPNAEFVLAGTGEGFSVDYGHMDLVLGDNAPQEVYGVVGAFILEQSRPEPASGSPK